MALLSNCVNAAWLIPQTWSLRGSRGSRQILNGNIIADSKQSSAASAANPNGLLRNWNNVAINQTMTLINKNKPQVEDLTAQFVGFWNLKHSKPILRHLWCRSSCVRIWRQRSFARQVEAAVKAILAWREWELVGRTWHKTWIEEASNYPLIFVEMNLRNMLDTMCLKMAFQSKRESGIRMIKQKCADSIQSEPISKNVALNVFSFWQRFLVLEFHSFYTFFLLLYGAYKKNRHLI